ncbi:MAG TPA: SIS domain-containing protein [Anaerolineae bacterium]|nr:SIS domain-containing protein [Anaerolineae bacterium]
MPDLLNTVSKLYAKKASETVEEIRKCTSFFVIGSGPNIATADESALGISQSAGVPAQAFPAENFLHGPIQTLRDHMGVIAIAAPGPLQERIIQAAEASKVIGSKVIVLAPKNMEGLHDFDVALRLPDGIPELLTPVIYITPLWQIAYHFSLLGRGCHTDRLSMDKPEFKKAFLIIMQEDKKFE